MIQYSTFDELSVMLRLDSLNRIDIQHLVEADALFPRPGMRESIAGALVRLGVSLDHAAGERVLSAAAGRAAQ